MKTQFKKYIKIAGVAMLVTAVVSCGNKGDKYTVTGEKSASDDKTQVTASDTATFQGKEMANEYNLAMSDTANLTNEQFLIAAANINLEEIALGKLAQEKSGNSKVKGLGKMMQTSHQDTQKEVEALAAKKSIAIPSQPSLAAQATYDSMKMLSVADFDKAYTDKMVDGHKKAIGKFEKASNSVTDPDVKKWASSTLPVLKTHLEHSIMCQESINNSK